MCRSIKRLRQGDIAASEEDVQAAARQFVRKISGFGAPAPHNSVAFEAAVDEIAASSRRLLGSLKVRSAHARAGRQRRPAPGRTTPVSHS